MAVRSGGVRGRRTAAASVAVTGAGSGLGLALVRRLAGRDDLRRLVGIDVSPADVAGVTWRIADVRDPLVTTRLGDVDVVVHLALDLRPDAPATERRALNVQGTATVLAAASAAAVRKVVLVTSAMVYGAQPDNPVPLGDDAPVRADRDATLVGDWVEIERLAEQSTRTGGGTEVVVLRPATLVGPGADSALTRLFDAPRLLAVKGSTPRWQFCHVDDLLAAIEVAVVTPLPGPAAVASDGWLEQETVERITGLRRLVLPHHVAVSMAERLHRAGVLPAPASELGYLAHPWVVEAARLRAAGWAAAHSNEEALRAHVDARGAREGTVGRVVRSDATRAAAGATVALVGTVAIARARRRRRG